MAVARPVLVKVAPAKVAASTSRMDSVKVAGAQTSATNAAAEDARLVAADAVV